ncbi:reverse transcriptase [Caerostris darwini]|uniref:Reverse transcriptase n=1 Tax=Caerostris darwini TaxID=1538125 RepID=A0AAV4TW87_9ARAC|nr:reverse transcriptase [Caerostris darwini]
MVNNQKCDKELSDILAHRDKSSLVLQYFPMGDPTIELYCDIASNRIRPFVPEVYRKKGFSSLYTISHPGIKATVKLVEERYHRAGNGQVETLHRQLKAAIRSHSTRQRSTVDPTIHLGFRAAWKEDKQATTAEMLYGTPIRLPGEFLSPSSSTIDPATFVGKLRETMQELLPLTPKQQTHRAVFISKDLSTCSHVFLRTDTIKKVRRV